MNAKDENDQPRPQAGANGPRYEDVMADAVRVLTEAARRTRPVLERDEAASEAAGHPMWVDSGRRDPADWAEFVTHALAGAAANIGGIGAALAGRPGSWEAGFVRQLLVNTVGEDEQYLLEHRTEPVVVDLYVDELLSDLGVWDAYDEASQELDRRDDAIGIPTVAGPGWAGQAELEAARAQLPPTTEEQERQAEAIEELRGRLDDQRKQDWAQYGAALKANVGAALSRFDGLRVPVTVNVDLATYRLSTERDEPDYWGVIERATDEGIEATPVPGDGRSPLERLFDQPGELGEGQL